MSALESFKALASPDAQSGATLGVLATALGVQAADRISGNWDGRFQGSPSAQTPPFGVAWSPALGRLLSAEQAVRTPEYDSDMVAQAFAEWLVDAGRSGTGSVTLHAGRPLNFLTGSFPSIRRFHWVTDTNEAATWAEYERFDSPALTTSRIEHCTETGRSRSAFETRPDYALRAFGKEANGLSSSLTGQGVHSTEQAGDFWRRCHDGFSLIERVGPHYASWVRDSIACLVPSHFQHMGSCSHFEVPGLVQVSVDAPREDLMEMLVHEASHQYFNLLRRLYPLSRHVEASDWLFSPLARRARPPSMVLMAYHALWSMTRFIASAQSRRVAFLLDAWHRRRMHYEQLLESMEGDLWSSGTLSEMGMGLLSLLPSRQVTTNLET